MDFELQWLLLALPVAFALGWAASRFDLRQLKREREDSPQAYFKGLNLLLNEQQDQAIDAFIQAVQDDPDTAELHFALGNLFRRRGEFERAVRVHEHLLGRADLKAADRARAQLALAQDFMKAGLFDRAEKAWRALKGSKFEGDAQLALLSLYERSHDWTLAVAVAHELQSRGAGNFDNRLAHYECELAESADARGDADAALAALQRAQSAASKARPPAARPWVLAGQRLRRQGQHAQALQAWQHLYEQHPASFSLVVDDYAESALLCADPEGLETARQTLQGALSANPTVGLLRALQRLEPTAEPAQGGASRQRLQQHLLRHPSLSAAQMMLEQPPATWADDAWQALRDAVGRSAKPLQRYRCAVCGFEAQHYFWQCPGCLSWDSYPPQRLDDQ